MNACKCLCLLALLSADTYAHSVGLSNGSFETPVVVAPTQYQTIGVGGEPIGFGWQVTAGTVDAVIRGDQFGLNALDGLQWLDLDGVGPGTISQSFGTAAGASYVLTFAYANNTHTESGATVPASAQIRIADLGTSTNLISPLGIQHSTSTVANLNWTTSGAITFAALGSTTTLTFSSTDPASSKGGIFLDAVTIAAVPELPISSLMVFGMLLLAVGRRRSSVVNSEA